MLIDMIPRPTVKHPSAGLVDGLGGAADSKNERKGKGSHDGECFLKNYLMALLKGRMEKWTKHSGQLQDSPTECSLMCNKAIWQAR